MERVIVSPRFHVLTYGVMGVLEEFPAAQSDWNLVSGDELPSLTRCLADMLRCRLKYDCLSKERNG